MRFRIPTLNSEIITHQKNKNVKKFIPDEKRKLHILLARAAFHAYTKSSRCRGASSSDGKSQSSTISFDPPRGKMKLIHEDDYLEEEKGFFFRVYEMRDDNDDFTQPSPIVVAVRGPKNIATWWTNNVTADFVSADDNLLSHRNTDQTVVVAGDDNSSRGIKNAKVHRGFEEAAIQIFARLEDCLKDNDIVYRTVYFTGHSLGGAVSILLAARWATAMKRRQTNNNNNTTTTTTTTTTTKTAKSRHVVVRVVTFGAPKPGNIAFQNRLQKILGKDDDDDDGMVLFANRADIVPSLPSAELGYDTHPSSLRILDGAPHASSGRATCEVDDLATKMNNLVRLYGRVHVLKLRDRGMACRQIVKSHCCETYWRLLHDEKLADTATADLSQFCMFLTEALADCYKTAFDDDGIGGSVSNGTDAVAGTKGGGTTTTSPRCVVTRSLSAAAATAAIIPLETLAMARRAALRIDLVWHDIIRAGYFTTENCNALARRLVEIKTVYECEPCSEARESAVRGMGECVVSAEALECDIIDIIVEQASGGGVALSAGAGVAAGNADAFANEELRLKVINITDRLIETQQRYAVSTRRLAEGIMSTPGFFSYEGTSWCQIYMIIRYLNYRGEVCSRESCDYGNHNNWYKGVMRVEPGATNIVVMFSVRGGANVDYVHRGDSSTPWIRDENGYRVQEKFYFPIGDGVRHHFKIKGTSLLAYVSEEYDISFSDNWLL